MAKFDISEARSEGFINDYFFGRSQEKNEIVRFLEEHNVSEDIMNSIKNIHHLDINWLKGRVYEGTLVCFLCKDM